MNPTPEFIDREVKKVGGMKDGKPQFRVVWGADRFILSSDNVLINPYQKNRWHVEKLYQGEYEHCYTLAECPHRNLRDQKWCKQCFASGGEFLQLELGIVERVIRLIMISETLQNKALQQSALMEREHKKLEENAEKVYDAVLEAAPLTVPRSYEPNLTLTADEALGRSKFKQIN